MNKVLVGTGIETSILSALERFSFVSFYARTRGWYYLLSWSHRITGVLLVIFAWYHISSLPSLYWLGSSGQGVRGTRIFIIPLIEWLLTIPVIFHAFNGGRLILYESFGIRNDASMVRWVFGLSLTYLAILGILMLMGDQGASLFLFSLVVSVVALLAAYGLKTRIWDTGHSIFWKLQRMSGAFLLVMVPAYILLTHLNILSVKEVNVAVAGIQNLVVWVAHGALLVAALYHGGYGLWSVASDYLRSRGLRAGFTLLLTLLSLLFLWFGIRVILGI